MLLHLLDEHAPEPQPERRSRARASPPSVACSIAVRYALDDVVPLPGRLGGALDVAVVCSSRGRSRSREIALERLLRLVEPAFVERRDLAQERELRVRVLLVTELDLDRVGERLACCRPARRSG